MIKQFIIRAFWDDDAKIYWAESNDIPGLHVEAVTLEELNDILRDVVPELLEANGLLGNNDREIPMKVFAERNLVAAH